MSDAFVIRRELVENSSAGSAIDRTLQTSVVTTLSTCLKAVGNEVVYSRKNVESRVKRKVKRKLLNRSRRTTTDGWRLNDEEFDKLHEIYRFTVEGCL